jgi:hypothetical protein
VSRLRPEEPTNPGLPAYRTRLREISDALAAEARRHSAGDGGDATLGTRLEDIARELRILDEVYERTTRRGRS